MGERHAPWLRPDPDDREVLRFLAREVAPLLARSGASPLAAAVGRAGTSRSLRELCGLPERQQRELLATIEARLAAHPRGLAPRALVRLTSVVATLPPLDPRLARGLASPAR